MCTRITKRKRLQSVWKRKRETLESSLLPTLRRLYLVYYVGWSVGLTNASVVLVLTLSTHDVPSTV